MEKKLSEIWANQKLEPESLSFYWVKLYGDIRVLEHTARFHQRVSEQKEAKKNLERIAQEHGITDYRL